MKRIICFLIILLISGQVNSCPIGPEAYENLLSRLEVTDDEQTETLEDFKSMVFGITKSEILSRYREPDLVVPENRSLEGEIWAYRSARNVNYGFAFAFKDGQLAARRFDLDSSVATVKYPHDHFSDLQKFECKNLHSDNEVESSFLYSAEVGATMEIYERGVSTIIWRFSDVGELRSHDLNTCRQVPLF